MEIGALIKEARIKKSLTQDELGKIVGVQKSAVAKWENGRVSNIKRSHLQKLADALEIDVVSLLGVEQENAPTSERDKSVEMINKLFSQLPPEKKLDALAYISELLDNH